MTEVGGLEVGEQHKTVQHHDEGRGKYLFIWSLIYIRLICPKLITLFK
jgi:hypothetical protein